IQELETNMGSPQLVARALQIAEELAMSPPDEIKPLLMTLLRRVEIKPDAVEINICRQQLMHLLEGQLTDPLQRREKADEQSEGAVTLKIATRLQRAGRQMRMVVQNSNDQRPPDPSLLRILARAHDVQTRLM